MQSSQQPMGAVPFHGGNSTWGRGWPRPHSSRARPWGRPAPLTPVGGLVSPFWPQGLRPQPALSLTLGSRGNPMSNAIRPGQLLPLHTPAQEQPDGLESSWAPGRSMGLPEPLRSLSHVVSSSGSAARPPVNRAELPSTPGLPDAPL